MTLAVKAGTLFGTGGIPLLRQGSLQGAMQQFAWFNLEKRFRKLQRDGGNLCAYWSAAGWDNKGRHWYLSGARDKRQETNFTNLVTAAVFKLNPGITSNGALSYWLDLLRHNSPNFRGGGRISTPGRRGKPKHSETGTIDQVCEASADYCVYCASNELRQPAGCRVQDLESFNAREKFVMPILRRKGWSIGDWASDSNVDVHTTRNYLKGKTQPYLSTRKKLADLLGIAVRSLPK